MNCYFDPPEGFHLFQSRIMHKTQSIIKWIVKFIPAVEELEYEILALSFRY